jgi:hypothetical protein
MSWKFEIVNSILFACFYFFDNNYLLAPNWHFARGAASHTLPPLGRGGRGGRVAWGSRSAGESTRPVPPNQPGVGAISWRSTAPEADDIGCVFAQMRPAGSTTYPAGVHVSHGREPRVALLRRVTLGCAAQRLQRISIGVSQWPFSHPFRAAALGLEARWCGMTQAGGLGCHRTATLWLTDGIEERPIGTGHLSHARAR